MHVLITGGAGFIGSHIAEYHLKKGDKVYVVDNLSTGSLNNLSECIKNPNFQYEIADILTWDNLIEAVHWADRIYHMAAVVGLFRVLDNPVEVLATNVVGCERVLRAVATHKWHPQLMIASSSSVYGGNVKQPHQEDDLLTLKSSERGLWSYAISKFADEAFCRAYAKKNGVKVTIVRLFNTVGPRQSGSYGMVIPRFIEQATHAKPITIHGDGNQTRSFCDVRDSVEMFDLLVSNPKSINEIVNVGNDREISINDLALLTKKITHSDSAIKHLSYTEAYGEEIDDIKRRLPCLKKLHSLINFSNKWCLEDTIKDLAQRQLKNEHEIITP